LAVVIYVAKRIITGTSQNKPDASNAGAVPAMLPVMPAMLPVMLPLLGAYLAFFIFSALYQTHLNPRYVAPHIPLLTLLFAVALVFLLFNKKALMAASAAVLSCILLVQNVVTYDPLTLALFGRIDIGKTELATAMPGTAIELGTPSTYNRQLGYQGVTFERLLSHIGYDESTVILVDDLYWQDDPNLPGPTYHAFFSWRGSLGKTFLYDPTERRLRYLLSSSTGQDPGLIKLDIRIIHPTKTVSLSDYSEYSRVFFVTASWREGFEQYQPIRGLPVLEEGIVGYHYWQMEYLRLK
jgi:hypothetical protein